jgi:hypothetical protein
VENELRSGKSKRGRGAEKRAHHDFSEAKALFAAGVLSMRAIGRRCGIPERTLRHHAKAERWERAGLVDIGTMRQGNAAPDLSEAQTELPQSAHVAISGLPGAVDPAAIADRGRDLVVRMLAELEAITSHSDELRAAILDATKDDGDGRRRARLLRLIDLPSRAIVLKDLAAAARTLGDAAPAPGGKKEEAKGKAAKVATSGRFATPPVPPKLIVNNEPG